MELVAIAAFIGMFGAFVVLPTVIRRKSAGE
jgi:hypothetical protein